MRGSFAAGAHCFFMGNGVAEFVVRFKRKREGLAAVALTTDTSILTVGGGQLKELCDLCLCVPSDVTARIQEAHILIGHIVCEMIDEVYSHVS